MTRETEAESADAWEEKREGGLPEKLPVLPLSQWVLYPGMALPVRIEREEWKRVVDEALSQSQPVVAVARKEKEKEGDGKSGPPWQGLYDVGTVATVTKLIRQPDGSYQIMLQGGERARLREFVSRDGFLEARIEPYATPHTPMTEITGPGGGRGAVGAGFSSTEVDALTLNLRSQFDRLIELAHLPRDLAVVALNVGTPAHLAYMVAANLTINMQERQTLLELPDLPTILERTTFYINRQIERLELAQQIQERVKAGLDKRQREHFLREQLHAIRRELGEGDLNPEFQELWSRLESTEMPAEARQAAEKEIERLGRMSIAAAEYSVSRTYVDLLLEMPWNRVTQDALDIQQAARILDEDHVDLEKVKRRILEYLAVLQLKRDMRGPILCFVGPPGVGKTSLGQSIARSLGRKFLRISLGGLRDEAELRGHRRTYVGALPGRIIQGLRRVGSCNPVFLLDEIDKLGADFRGDPASALLEILDPEQNASFTDHYLAVPFDLSRVIFLVTANWLDPIPAPLKDRLEIIEIPGYIEQEKISIARSVLIERQAAHHGLLAGKLDIPDDAIREVIRSYTREAGVRQLDRNLAAICRHVARKVVEGQDGDTVVKPEDLSEILGPVRFVPETSTRSWGPGIATGLAWTPSGGELMFIEALRIRGHGKLTLTGQLGGVMRESGAAAMTFIRAHAKELGISDESFDRVDVHVHVPAGGIPKDGPSAGIAMAAVLASLMSQREVRRDVAMTGEITLRGDLLPVGGIKEKILAARRAGLREVLLPYGNAKDLEGIPEPLREGMVIHTVQLIRDALEIVLVPGVVEETPPGGSPSEAQAEADVSA